MTIDNETLHDWYVDLHDVTKPAGNRLQEVANKIHAALDGKTVGDYKESFSGRVHLWVLACFGIEKTTSAHERNLRFIEEALELVQANGMTEEKAHELVTYVFARPIGVVHQEIGGVMTTLAALASAAGFDMMEEGERELTRVQPLIDKIRERNLTKPR